MLSVYNSGKMTGDLSSFLIFFCNALNLSLPIFIVNIIHNCNTDAKQSQAATPLLKCGMPEQTT